ncbi:MAG: hypothetical protein GTO30_13445 [Acidobacteria bacterium]|nr:hypothetical protein [Acidobacteriota bacterium]NIM62600.1 hypothetical protein [Acidobacteriota bacterium]NIO60120.1 hypothetical protein [Acidobacteriota bacterium]NIQ86872.1 hypothetical protein [Acidobacteriota bacterium]NIT12193.1 hypothetical protein [Acidobacteriota bacterium]
MTVARLVALAALLLAGCAPRSPGEAAASGPDGFHFVDVAAEAGLTRVLHAGRPGKDHLLDSAGTGAAWLDYDRDGHLDAYLVNGWKLSGSRVVEKGRNALYRNRGDTTFEDVTDAAGVDGDGAWGSGVAVADYDDDGWPDILVTNFGANVLYRNRGDGTFENVAARAGVEAAGWNTGAAFFDADADGDLDLYIAAYIVATIDEVLGAGRTLDWKGVDKVAFGPFGLTGARDHFFLNNGDGTFVEATDRAGMRDLVQGFGFGTRAADFDADGDVDLYVANDSDANYLYRNEGDGTFKETALWSGAAFDANGAAQAGMGIAAGDVNGDLVPDLFVTNFSEDFSTLYLGEGRGFFRDASDESAIGAATFVPLSWGTVLADLDNDGDHDLVIANGHIYPQVDDHPQFGMTYAQRNQLLANDGHGRFEDVSERAGPGFAIARSSRGLAAGDYDNDGDLDLLITSLDAPPALLRNDSTIGGWLTVACEVPPGQGGVIGTRVEVRVGERRTSRDVASGESFLSVHDARLHFGLGAAAEADEVRVRWPDGTTRVEGPVRGNRFLVLEKGR